MTKPCDHQWVTIHDSEGDPDVVNGVRHFTETSCAKCGATDDDDENEDDGFIDDYDPAERDTP